MTPGARWRPRLPAGAFILGPARCHDCGAPVWFGRSMTRVLGEVTLGEVKAWREWGRFAVHVHVPVRRVPKAPGRYAMLANARAEWDNRQAGSSSESHRLSADARASATTGGAGVVESVEVVAR